MTLPLDTHLENSQSHYYEDRFPIFLFTVYIDPIFIAIVPRFQETLATLAGNAMPIVCHFLGGWNIAYIFYPITAHHNTAECATLKAICWYCCCPSKDSC